MTIHNALQIANTKYPNEPIHIFTNCLNNLYVIKTQIKHPILHNNHLVKTILEEIVKFLQICSFPLFLYKVHAHANIERNKQANKLAKKGRDKEHLDIVLLHEFADNMPYNYQKDWWHSMNETPNKGPIKFLQKHIIKYDRRINLEIIATQFFNINK